jgi:hypothetical protein
MDGLFFVVPDCALSKQIISAATRVIDDDDKRCMGVI